MNDIIGSNNVIIFPKKSVKEPKYSTFEEIDRNVELIKHYHIQETIASIAPMIFNQLDIAGFSMVGDEEIQEDELLDIKDGAFIIESLRSAMCKYYGIYHPFQRISQEVFVEDEEDPDALKIVDELTIDLKRSENIEE
jgi:hypothetical protein